MFDFKKVPSYAEALKKMIPQLREMLPKKELTIFNADAEQLAINHPTPLQLQVGDPAPLFTLPNATGQLMALEGLLKQGPVVLVFYRGAWCPYCNLQLKTYQQILPQIKSAGASLIAISPQTPDHSLSFKEKNELAFEVLSDAGNKVGEQFTRIFKNDDAPLQAMTDLGYDFHDFYSDDFARLPVPATFVIHSDGTIGFAHSGGGDYRERTEPAAILDALDL